MLVINQYLPTYNEGLEERFYNILICFLLGEHVFCNEAQGTHLTSQLTRSYNYVHQLVQV